MIETGERKSERSFYVSDEVNVSVGKRGHAAVRNTHENFNDSQQRRLLCLHCPSQIDMEEGFCSTESLRDPADGESMIL